MDENLNKQQPDITQPINNPVPQQNSNISNSTSIGANSPTKTSYSNLPLVLIILGIVETIITGLYLLNLIFIVPKISRLYTELDVKPTNIPYVAIIFLLIFTLLAISQTIYGFKLKKINKEQGQLSSKHRKFAILILVSLLIIVLLSMSATVFSVILPIYNLTSAF